MGGRDNPQVGNEGASAVENHAQSFRQSHHPGERVWLRDYSAHYAIFQVGYSAFCGREVGGKGFRRGGKAGGNWFQKRKEEGMKKKENWVGWIGEWLRVNVKWWRKGKLLGKINSLKGGDNQILSQESRRKKMALFAVNIVFREVEGTCRAS